MKAVRWAMGLALVLAVTACGGSDKATAKSPVMPDVVGRKLDVAKSDIKRAGFDDKVEVVGGGTFGIVVESNWTVCEQLPAAGKAIKAPRLTVDRSCDSGATTSTEASTTTTTAPATSASPTTAAPSQEVLTAANSPDLAALLAVTDDCSDTVQHFASTYPGRTIEFDGNIAAMALHGNDQTRYDILVVPGDFGASSPVGPNFQFRDVNVVYDLHLTGSNIPENIGQGDNLHVIARVDDYDSDSCLFLLTPVSTQVR